MATESKDKLTLPRVFIISRETAHRDKLERFLGRHFDSKVFDDTHAAGDAIAEAPPDVTLVDIERVWQNEINWLSANTARINFKSLPLVLIGAKGEEFEDMRALFGNSSRYLTWPLKAELLIKTVSTLINEAVEASWEELPQGLSRPLKMTVEEYQSIATAIENGDPINYDSANNSCAPLIEAVRGGAHHDILKTVQAHHNYTYVHSMRVATLLTLFGYGIGIKGDDLQILSTGGLLHDTGKLVTPLSILDKPGKLNDKEWPVMKNHVIRSGELLDGIDNITKGAMIIAEQHHEKIDGSGYPRGLKGGELNNLARMSAIVDIFGALTDCRSYKPAFPAEKAFAILESMETGIDQNMLAMFREIFSSTQPEKDEE